jgi:hypothetical protein
MYIYICISIWVAVRVGSRSGGRAVVSSVAGGRLTPHKNWFQGGRPHKPWQLYVADLSHSAFAGSAHHGSQDSNVVAPTHYAAPFSTTVTLPPSRSRRCATFSGVGQGTVLPGLRCWARRCAAWPLVVGSAVLCWACVCEVEWFWSDELEWAGWRTSGVGWSATSWCWQTEEQKQRPSK